MGPFIAEKRQIDDSEKRPKIKMHNRLPLSVFLAGGEGSLNYDN
jgi:hypothetical protein